jgi:hypothetical protein
MKRKADEMRDEYPEDLIKSGVRGKFSTAYRNETNGVVIDADLRSLFPDSVAVNRALRDYMELKKKKKRASTGRGRRA